MSDIIEGTAVVVSEDPKKNTDRYQVTIKARTDHKLSNLENIVVDLEGKPTRADAWTVLVPYLVRKVNRSEVRTIFEVVLHGGKPKFSFKEGKHIVEFTTEKGEFVETYELTFIKL